MWRIEWCMSVMPSQMTDRQADEQNKREGRIQKRSRYTVIWTAAASPACHWHATELITGDVKSSFMMKGMQKCSLRHHAPPSLAPPPPSLALYI
jgi:hypothetical protein